jgi:hypothetical protein
LKYGTGNDTTTYTKIALADTQYIVTTGLGAGATYNWYVVGKNTYGTSKSSTYSFTMSTNTAPPIPWGTVYMKDPRNGKEIWVKLLFSVSGSTISVTGVRPDQSTFVIQ